jgi:Ca2+-binding EF-hand superfamily protein
VEDFVIAIFRRFDLNQDGAISFSELRDGLNSMNVRLEDTEVRNLFNRLDTDHDGTVTNYELYSAICAALEGTAKYSAHKFTSVDTVMWMIKKQGEKYPILREFADFLMRKFDMDGDGLIGFEELNKGLKSIEVKATDQELLALMRLLDRDRDGGVSKFELYAALDQEIGGGKASQVNNNLQGYAVENIINQIKKKIDPYKSQGEQVLGLMKIFDKDNDGLISYTEMVDGIRVLGIKATRGDVMDLMQRIDIDKDGIVTQMELSRALGLYNGSLGSPSKYTSKGSLFK